MSSLLQISVSRFTFFIQEEKQVDVKKKCRMVSGQDYVKKNFLKRPFEENVFPFVERVKDPPDDITVGPK